MGTLNDIGLALELFGDVILGIVILAGVIWFATAAVMK